MKSKNYKYNIYGHAITRELANVIHKYTTVVIARTSFMTSPG